MKAFTGKEFEVNNPPDPKTHKVILEDDENYYGCGNPEELWCGMDPDDAKQIIDFITQAQILGIDNGAVNKAHELRDLLKKQLENKEVNKIMNH